MTRIRSVTNQELVDLFGETPSFIAQLAKEEDAIVRGELPSYVAISRKQGRPRLNEREETVAFSHKETADKAELIRASAQAHGQTLSDFWREASTALLQARGEMQNA